MEEQKDANNQEAPSALEGAIASSPEAQEVAQQTPDTETGTPQQPVSQEQAQPAAQEPPFHEHPRFKEIVDEKNHWREVALNLQQITQQQPPKQPEVFGDTPEAREFYDGVRRIARQEAEKIRQETEPKLLAAQQEFARIKVDEFRRNHADVKPNSPEEGEIAGLIRAGYDPNHAYWSVMGPRGVQNVRQQATQQVRQQMQIKKQANVESSGVPNQSGLPSSKKSFEQDLDDRLREAGY